MLNSRPHASTRRVRSEPSAPCGPSRSGRWWTGDTPVASARPLWESPACGGRGRRWRMPEEPDPIVQAYMPASGPFVTPTRRPAAIMDPRWKSSKRSCRQHQSARPRWNPKAGPTPGGSRPGWRWAGVAVVVAIPGRIVLSRNGAPSAEERLVAVQQFLEERVVGPVRGSARGGRASSPAPRRPTARRGARFPGWARRVSHAGGSPDEETIRIPTGPVRHGWPVVGQRLAETEVDVHSPDSGRLPGVGRSEAPTAEPDFGALLSGLGPPLDGEPDRTDLIGLVRAPRGPRARWTTTRSGPRLPLTACSPTRSDAAMLDGTGTVEVELTVGPGGRLERMGWSLDARRFRRPGPALQRPVRLDGPPRAYQGTGRHPVPGLEPAAGGLHPRHRPTSTSRRESTRRAGRAPCGHRAGPRPGPGRDAARTGRAHQRERRGRGRLRVAGLDYGARPPPRVRALPLPDPAEPPTGACHVARGGVRTAGADPGGGAATGHGVPGGAASRRAAVFRSARAP